MNIYDDTIVYVLAPAYYYTGGVELLHQIVSQLLGLGCKTKLVYLGDTADPPETKAYKKYHLQCTNDIHDNNHNIFIVPETMTNILSKVSQIQKVIWWLSVDNFLNSFKGYVSSLEEDDIKKYPLQQFFWFSQYANEITHFVQSEYARSFLKLNGIKEENIAFVEDYLSQEFIMDTLGNNILKEDIVVYNPKKGIETTQKLMAARPEICWQPIQNMTPQEVHNLLMRAKVYIDFGNHPGKDRIPREAAMSDCVVITGRRGAAANDIDINIPDKFKCSDNEIETIMARIDDALSDYDSAYKEQYAYRQRIRDDFPRFRQELVDTFQINEDVIPQWSAVVNDGAGTGIKMAQVLATTPSEFRVKFLVDDKLANPQNTVSGIVVRKERCYLPVTEGTDIEIITSADADFLYGEKRIMKFFAMEKQDEAQKLLVEQLRHVPKEDILLV